MKPASPVSTLAQSAMLADGDGGPPGVDPLTAFAVRLLIGAKQHGDLFTERLRRLIRQTTEEIESGRWPGGAA